MTGRASLTIPPGRRHRVIGELIPFLKLTGVVDMDSELEKQLVKLPLVPRIYLDKEGKEVVARTLLCYGDKEIDPFDEHEEDKPLAKGEKLLLRDAAAERQVLDTLANAGFYVRKGRVYLTGQEAIYDFVSQGVGKLQAQCEVYLSKDFKKMTPRRPVLRGRMGLPWKPPGNYLHGERRTRAGSDGHTGGAGQAAQVFPPQGWFLPGPERYGGVAGAGGQRL